MSIEFRRRACLVYSQMQSAMITHRTTGVSLSQLLNFLVLLAQEPLLVFVYTRDPISGNFSFKEYFDHVRALRGRWNARLEGCAGSITLESIGSIELDSTDASNLIQVFESNFYLRVFHLADSEDTEFRDIALDIVSELGSAERFGYYQLASYAAICAGALFSEKHLSVFAAQSAENGANHGQFLCEYKKWVEDVFVRDRYINASLHAATIPEHEYKTCAGVFREWRKEMLNDHLGLDRIYRRLSTPARAIRLLAGDEQPGSPDIPNLFWLFRTFSRRADQPNRARLETESGLSDGYSYNLHFMMSAHQLQDASEYLFQFRRSREWQKKSERFGTGYEGELNASKKTPTEKSELLAFVQDLDREFWRLVDRGHAKVSVAYERYRRTVKDAFPSSGAYINPFLARVFRDPFSDEAASFADPLFFGGTINIRHPFRRMAGLGRIKLIAERMRGYSDKPLTVSRLQQSHPKVLNDCFRVIAFFYLSRGAAQRTGDACRDMYRTKLVLFPVAVGQSVVGVVGCTLLEDCPDDEETRKARFAQDGYRFTSTSSANWDLVFHFYRDVYTPALDHIRRLYRDLQIRFLRTELLQQLSFVLSDEQVLSGGRIVSIQSLESALDGANELSLIQSRFTAYDPILLRRLPMNEEVLRSGKGINFLNLFAIALDDVSNPVFPRFVEDRSDIDPVGNVQDSLGLSLARLRIEEALKFLIEGLVPRADRSKFLN
jgi:hypothetical protein